MDPKLCRPDTCSCQIVYDKDNNNAYVATLVACPHHTAVSGTAAHWAAVQAENIKKGNILNQIAVAAGLTPQQAVDQGFFTFFVNPISGAMSIQARAIPAATLSALNAQHPEVTIIVNPAL